MPLERKTPVAYPDGVYEIAGQDRPNVLLIANVTQNGLTGFGSRERTGLFIFFGMNSSHVYFSHVKSVPLGILRMKVSNCKIYRSASGGGDAGCPKAWLHP